MTSPRVKRFAFVVVVPLIIATVAAIFGTSLPIIAYEMTHGGTFEPHSLIWESIFGFGYYCVAWICDLFSLNYESAPAVLIGMVLWPLFVMLALFLVSRRLVQTSRRTQLISMTAFLLSLCLCVGHDASNYLALHGVPLFWNYYAVLY
jgi:hypothetical protein